MARLKLKTKEAKPSEPKNIMTIQKISMKSTYIAQNDPANYGLLKDNRCKEEKFSRIDRFWVNHYYLVDNEWLSEKIFYPSEHGFEMIEKEKYKSLIELRDRLINDGIGFWGEKPVLNTEKPRRVRLECKE